MKFVDLISYYHIPYVSEKGIAIWKINSEIREEENIPGIDSHAILFVVGGSMEISVQGKIQSLTRGYFVDVLGDKQSVKLLSASPDIQAYFLLLTDEYLLELFKNRPPLPLSYAMDIMQNPVYMIENSFIVSIIKCLDDIEQTMANPLHHFQDSMLKCKISVLLLQMSEILLYKTQKEKRKSRESDRKRTLFAQFMKLLSEYVKEEHTVNFYASRLNVTPQYLRRVVKVCSGKNAYTWICEELVREIVNLLINTDKTMQAIADELHFSDQAVLTKFFRRIKGVSPLQYRNGIE